MPSTFFYLPSRFAHHHRGGYYVNQEAGEFDYSHPEIVHGLEHSREPCYSFGYLAEALDRRCQCGLSPFTIVPCDNLLQNGNVAKKMILAFAERGDPALSRKPRESLTAIWHTMNTFLGASCRQPISALESDAKSPIKVIRCGECLNGVTDYDAARNCP